MSDVASRVRYGFREKHGDEVPAGMPRTVVAPGISILTVATDAQHNENAVSKTAKTD